MEWYTCNLSVSLLVPAVSNSWLLHCLPGPGRIMFEETLFQKGADGKVFAETLKSKGIIPGIKVYPGPFTLEQSALMPDSPPTSAAAC